jgi:transmembrane sensor
VSSALGRRGSFIERLRQADAELREQRLSPVAEARLLELVDRQAVRRRPWLLLAPVGAMVAVLLVLWILLGRAPSVRGPTSSPELGGFALIEGRAEVESRGVRCEAARCTLAASDLRATLTLSARAVMQRRGQDLALVAGAVTCVIEKRRASAPLRVHVSHGAVEVIGTIFALSQDSEGGQVELQRGAIRFLSSDGRAVLLRPGESLRWPLPPATRPAASAPAFATPRPAASRPRPLAPAEVESLLDLIERLRSQGRYAEAARQLRQLLPRIADGATRERMSYELGTLLGQHLRDVATACRHWRRHLLRFGAARYGVEIEAARRQLGCEKLAP